MNYPISFKKSLPLVTIITSVLNDSENLKNAIASIRSQNYKNIEYIVIDGGSTDSTIEVIKANQDIITKWITEKDTGIYNAWNKGLDFANGEWISFLGADDVFMPNVIETLINTYLERNETFDYISGKTDLYKSDQYLKTTGGPFVWSKFRKYVCTGHNAALHHKSLYERFGKYDESFRSAADYEFLLRSGPKLKALYVDMVTTRMNLGGASNNNIKAIYESHKARSKNNSNPIFLEFILLLKGYLSFYLKR